MGQQKKPDAATVSRIEPVERATKRSWGEWLAFMERIGAAELDHRQIAEAVARELEGAVDNPGWWAQSVTVAYEQYSGRRIPGQRPDGTFETSVSKATPLGMAALMERWAAFASGDPDVRRAIATEPKVGGTDKRITWRAKAHDGSAVVITSEPKPSGTATIIAQLTGLATPAESAAAKERWGAALVRFLDGL